MKRFFPCLVFCIGILCPSVALDREAFTVTRYQLEVQIDRASHVMAVTGQVTLRNDSKAPQKNLVLQVSSSLAWNGIALDRQPVEWIGSNYTSDIDHTGHLSEAIATLPKAVLPGGMITLDVQYGGTITPDATRLTRMGAPEEMALRNDWDQISGPFTAVRGLGYVVWYPVSIPAVSMSDGNAVFEAIDQWKFRHQHTNLDAHVSVISGEDRLCIAGNAMAASCGDVTQTSDPHTGGATRQVSNTIHLEGLGQTVPVFTVADYAKLDRPTIVVFHTPDRVSQARDYAAAAEANEPVLNEWLAPATKAAEVIELTDPNANPYQAGGVLFTPLRQAQITTLQLLLFPVEVAARFSSPRRWIEDGLQRFLQAISIERRSGRKEALQFLGEYLPPLIAAEKPVDSGTKSNAAAKNDRLSGDNLLNTSDEILLRGKGSYVFWMLRDMIGDTALQKALAAYRPGADANSAYFQGLLEDGRKRDLEWFFDDWVYRNRGLPDFRIDNVYERQTLEAANGLHLVTVSVENLGGAGAEVPVSVQSPSGERSIRVLVKAHEKASERVQLPEGPTRAMVNDGSVPELNAGNNAFEVPVAPGP